MPPDFAMDDTRLGADIPPFIDEGISADLPALTAARLRAARTEMWRGATLDQRTFMLIVTDACAGVFA